MDYLGFQGHSSMVDLSLKDPSLESSGPESLSSFFPPWESVSKTYFKIGSQHNPPTNPDTVQKMYGSTKRGKR